MVTQLVTEISCFWEHRHPLWCPPIHTQVSQMILAIYLFCPPFYMHFSCMPCFAHFIHLDCISYWYLFKHTNNALYVISSTFLHICPKKKLVFIHFECAILATHQHSTTGVIWFNMDRTCPPLHTCTLTIQTVTQMR